MKTLLSFSLMMLAVSLQAANPSFKSFRGTGGVGVSSNEALGIITIDGSSIAGGGGGTNSSVALAVNGAVISGAATQVNLVVGTNIFLTSTNNPNGTVSVGVHMNSAGFIPSTYWRVDPATGDLIPTTTDVYNLGRSGARPFSVDSAAGYYVNGKAGMTLSGSQLQIGNASFWTQMHFVVGGVTRMFMESNHVSIGDVNPQHMLDVYGTIRGRRLLLADGTGVFAKTIGLSAPTSLANGYNLIMPLTIGDGYFRLTMLDATNAAVTFDTPAGGGGGSTQMVTFAAGSGTITNNLSILGNALVSGNVQANDVSISDELILSSLNPLILLRLDAGNVAVETLIGNGISFDGQTLAVASSVTNGLQAAIQAKQTGSMTLSNFLAMGITNIIAGANVTITTNSGVLSIASTGSGGGGATLNSLSNGWLRLQLQSCILPTNNLPSLDTGTNLVWRLLFDDTTAETAYWDFVLPDDYGTNATVVCTYSTLVAAATKTNCFVFQTQVLKPLASNNINVDSWSASGGATNVIPTTAGWSTNFSGNLSLSAVAGDFVRLKINRDAASAMDSATGDTALHSIAIRYTKQ